MNRVLEFDTIINKLEEYAYTKKAKEKFRGLKPYLSEVELLSRLKETTEAREILDKNGTPPLVSMKDINKLLTVVNQGGMLSPSELEYIEMVLGAVKRLKDFLNKCKDINTLGYYSDEIEDLENIRENIYNTIKNGKVDDYASNELKDIRRKIQNLNEKIRIKAEELLKSNKQYCSESFVSNCGVHICLPIKKEYKSKIEGNVIEKSRTGATLFIEPRVISNMTQELNILKADEDNEERKILYTLSALISDSSCIFEKNMNIIEELDFIFAKGKLSAQLDAKEPLINTKRYMAIKQGRHPLLNKEKCVPLDFDIGNGVIGVIITGPNTGGKTVAIKTVGLLSIMAQSGLHIPCEKADICMNSQVLCDIGDGQNITENLSTFSAHITNILNILNKANNESLVILDELGSGTDPTEGMGIAITILNELKKKNCLFLATTHYPEVKSYAEKESGIINARMAFDKETLKPIYKLEIGKAGESCALYIARKLGMTNEMINRAYKEAYGVENSQNNNLQIENTLKSVSNKYIPKIEKKKEYKEILKPSEFFKVGDSVIVYPEKKIGIVYKKANEKGEVLVQIQKEKIFVNHKRLKLKIAASELYPENYDFSIIFDTVENRKTRHQMGKRHRPDLKIETEE